MLEQIENPFAVKNATPTYTADVEGAIAFLRAFLATTDRSADRKFVDADLYSDVAPGGGAGPLAVSANCFALGYAGTFPYLHDMKMAVRQYGRLTPAQVRGTLNCMLSEIRHRLNEEARTAKASPAQAVPVVTQAPLQVGYYTMVQPDGERRTLRILKPSYLLDGQHPDTLLIAFLSGPDNTNDYVRFASAVGTQVRFFSRYSQATDLRDAIRTLSEMGTDQRREAGKAYAMVSGNCCRCGRLLTVPASIAKGIGPECASKGF